MSRAVPQYASSPLTSLERNEVTGALGGANTANAVGGIATVTFAVLGLAGVASNTMLGIAMLLAGAALVTSGLASIAAFGKLDWDVSTPEHVVSRGGFGIEALGGMAGVIAAVLVLADLATITAISVAAVVIGASILLSAPARTQMDWSKLDAPPKRLDSGVEHAVRNAIGVGAMTGMFAAILGIMAVTDTTRALTFGLCSLLLIGGAMVVEGFALLGRLAVLAEPSSPATAFDREITSDGEGFPDAPIDVDAPFEALTDLGVRDGNDEPYVRLEAMDIIEIGPFDDDERTD